MSDEEALLTLRDCTIADLPQVLIIYNEIILNTTAVYSYSPHTLDMRVSWFKERTESGFPVHVVEGAGKILGFASYGKFRAWAGFKYTVENSVYVSPEARGKGVGKLLLQATIDHAKNNNVHAIVAGIDASNEVSVRLHKKLGFIEAGNMKQVGFKFGRWLDLAFLQLTFDTPTDPNENES